MTAIRRGHSKRNKKSYHKRGRVGGKKSNKATAAAKDRTHTKNMHR